MLESFLTLIMSNDWNTQLCLFVFAGLLAFIILSAVNDLYSFWNMLLAGIAAVLYPILATAITFGIGPVYALGYLSCIIREKKFVHISKPWENFCEALDRVA